METPENSDRVEVTDKVEYQTYEIEWQGIALTIRHCPRWLATYGEFVTQHIEVSSRMCEPLPITETGYRSQFFNSGEVLGAFGNDPVAYVLAWLDEGAKSKEWLAKVEAARQHSLF